MIKWPKIQYKESEDGMLYPVIDFPRQPAGDIGKYGSMRRTYLKNHRPATYQMMILEGSLKQHLMDINRQAHEMLEQLIEGMKKSENVTGTDIKIEARDLQKEMKDRKTSDGKK